MFALAVELTIQNILRFGNSAKGFGQTIMSREAQRLAATAAFAGCIAWSFLFEYQKSMRPEQVGSGTNRILEEGPPRVFLAVPSMAHIAFGTWDKAGNGFWRPLKTRVTGP
jgi:hypothetical protein